MLKSYFLGFIGYMVLVPATADTQVARSPGPGSFFDPSAMAVPVSFEQFGPRAPEKLRETLRQTGEVSVQTPQPYRLTPQERQRLREQLRQQSVWTAPPAR
jgi:hypothetical protein